MLRLLNIFTWWVCTLVNILQRINVMKRWDTETREDRLTVSLNGRRPGITMRMESQNTTTSQGQHHATCSQISPHLWKIFSWTEDSFASACAIAKIQTPQKNFAERLFCLFVINCLLLGKHVRTKAIQNTAYCPHEYDFIIHLHRYALFHKTLAQARNLIVRNSNFLKDLP